MYQDIKGCPFCGRGANHYEKAASNEEQLDFQLENNCCHVVCCDLCFASTGEYITKQEAIDAWNSRY